MKNLLFILFALCTSQWVWSQDREQMVKEIEVAESILRTDTMGEMPIDEVAQIVPKYLAFVNAFPNDSLAPEYLFKAGEVSQGVGAYWKSVEYFNGVHMSYPDHERSPFALFFQGFVFYNYLNLPTYAKGSFLDFLDKYPGHALEKDVKAMIQLLHSSEEEYFRTIIEKNK